MFRILLALNVTAVTATETITGPHRGRAALKSQFAFQKYPHPTMIRQWDSKTLQRRARVAEKKNTTK